MSSAEVLGIYAQQLAGQRGQLLRVAEGITPVTAVSGADEQVPASAEDQLATVVVGELRMRNREQPHLGGGRYRGRAGRRRVETRHLQRAIALARVRSPEIRMAAELRVEDDAQQSLLAARDHP